MSALTLFGMPVVASPLCDNWPRFTLSPKVPVTQEFRDDFNKWALEFFGTESRVFIFNGTIAMSSKALAMLTIETERKNDA